MSFNFRFAIISDPHIALPTTVWEHPDRFHLVEISIPAFDLILQDLQSLDLDFLLLPGDLTQHGEVANHAWLSDRLSQLPYPAYVVPGNHDVPTYDATEDTIGLMDFPIQYQKFGYTDPQRPYYATEILPGVRLIGLNSNHFDAEGNQLGMGRIDPMQLDWLQATLADATQAEAMVMVMIHHNVIEHLPGQTTNSMGRRYMLENAADLLQLLQSAQVRLLFTGHLHVQDIAEQAGIYEITTGSLVSYPHPYRIVDCWQDSQGCHLRIQSRRVTQVPGWADLQHHSREWMGDRSFPFMYKLLTQPPLNLSIDQANQLAPSLRYFWADIANGDANFDFPEFPAPVNRYFQGFGAIDRGGNYRPIDNFVTLTL